MGDNAPKHDSLTNEQQAFINSSITAAVKDVFLALAPMFQQQSKQNAEMMQALALTPEKMLEMERQRRAPDPKLVAREARERALMKEDIEEARRNLGLRQRDCPKGHRDENNRYAVALIHNYPDRQPRGVCTHCHLLIEPTHWEIGAPDAQNPRGKAILVKAHPLYHVVLEIENTTR